MCVDMFTDTGVDKTLICTGHLYYLPAFIFCGGTILGFVTSAARKVGVVWGQVGVVWGQVGVV